MASGCWRRCAELGIESHLVMSKAAEMTIGYETNLKPKQVAAKADHAYAIGDIARADRVGNVQDQGHDRGALLGAHACRRSPPA